MSANLKVREEAMKSLLAFSLAVGGLVIPLPRAMAQFGGHSGGGHNGAVSVPPALGAITRPLGGFAPGIGNFNATRSFNFNNNFNRGSSRRGNGFNNYPYAYSVWVPDYFDYMNGTGAYGAPAAPPPGYLDPGLAGPPPGSQQPVIINQYFSGPPPAPQSYAPLPNGPEANNTSGTPGDPLSAPQNYYLIAYKNHAIYAALAYWVEDKTLHYVTTQNTHNQASMDLIDLTLTKSLNQDRQVPFSITTP
jgi:hypothetical protein